ncbi:MAG: YgjV family protein [Micrococcales bacterium]|nr:YgjV family protein [Micrococcales bacterium]
MSWLEALGWAGSALLVFSLLQARVLRLRVLNLIACVILAVYNGMIHVWPMMAMNIALTLINLWFIRSLLADRGDNPSYAALQVPVDDTYLQHFLEAHDRDIHSFFPGFPSPEQSARHALGRRAFLVQRGDETVGVVIARNAGRGVAQLELDYVTPRFRDFSPGDWVYRRSGLFRQQGFRKVVSPVGMVNTNHYGRVGFTRNGDAWELDV